METSLVRIEHFCATCNVDASFIHALKDYGIIEIIEVNSLAYVSHEQLKILERAIHFHYELNINLEGIDVIYNLLNQINALQEELRIAKNKVSNTY